MRQRVPQWRACLLDSTGARQPKGNPFDAGRHRPDRFNDNAAITSLSTFVPGFTEGLKYAVVAGAVSGGGLTVIANAPNPAGQSLLKKYFDNGVSPAGIVKAALFPTMVVLACFFIFR